MRWKAAFGACAAEGSFELKSDYRNCGNIGKKKMVLLTSPAKANEGHPKMVKQNTPTNMTLCIVGVSEMQKWRLKYVIHVLKQKGRAFLPLPSCNL